MGLYNLVKTTQLCQSCQHAVEFRVQFKFGEVWLHEYSVGDTLVWGDPHIGNSGYSCVVVDGVAENCPFCGAEGEDFEVWLKNDRIVDVRIASGKYRFTQETFIITDRQKQE